MDYCHIYDLYFVPSKGSEMKNPHIVFAMSKHHLEVFQKNLDHIMEIGKHISEEYFETCVEFTPLHIDMFGNYMFGYGRCGYMEIREDEVFFHFELGDGVNINYISLTVMFLLIVLDGMLTNDMEASGREQLIQIYTMCQHDVHGHSMHGIVSTDLGMWLKKQVENIQDNEAFARILLPEVGEVMRQTWNKIGYSKIKKSENDCCAMLYPDGRFTFTCPGNACDVSIYPDQSCSDMIGMMPVRFSSHNLDSAQQQITLLAGLAKLCELARN